MSSRKKSGFSLLETIVAVGVLLVAIVGPLSLASFGLKATSSAKNNLIAGYLAQEGIELVRAIRGNNGLQGNDWVRGLAPPNPSPGRCQSADGCYIGFDFPDLTVFALNQCTGAPVISGTSEKCPFLIFDAATGLYNYSSGQTSIFTRRINTTNLGSDETAVKVTVTWQEKFGMQSFSVDEIIYNWTP